MAVTRAEISEILNDLGYVLGALAVLAVFVSSFPVAAQYVALASVVSLTLANRVNPTNIAANLQAAVAALGKS